MSSLNSLEDYKLAKELIKINKWADMVRFARTGRGKCHSCKSCQGFNKKDIIVFVDIMGGNDWYLSANLSNKKNLDTHLFPNLRTSGVQKI